MSFTVEEKKEFQKMIVVGVGQALEDIVLPRFDQIEAKFDKKFEEVDKKFEEVRNDISKLERKLDRLTDHQAEKLDDHETRLRLVETAVVP